MKVECSYCHSKIEFDDKEYSPGEVVTVECRRCGEEMTVTIPTHEDVTSKKDKENVVVRRTAMPKDSELDEFGNVHSDVSMEDVNVHKHSISEESVGVPDTTIQNEIVESKDTLADGYNESANVKKRRKPRKAPVNKEFGTTTQDTSIQDSSKPRKAREQKSKENVENVPPVSQIPAQPQSSGNSGCVNWHILLVLIVLVGVGIWIFRSCGEKKVEATENTVSVVEEAPDEVEVIEETDEIVEDTAVFDTVVAVAAEVVEAPGVESEVERIYLPEVSKYTSSEAYHVYPAYVTEHRFGDSWATVDVVQDAIRNGMVECFVKGEGDIEGYPLSIDAVRLKDGRLFGRYRNDYNGVKLDINGAFDTNDDLVIKLGHKSEMSYWILKFVGTCEDGSLQYRGTWGRKDKPTSLIISVRDK